MQKRSFFFTKQSRIIVRSTYLLSRKRNLEERLKKINHDYEEKLKEIEAMKKRIKEIDNLNEENKKWYIQLIISNVEFIKTLKFEVENLKSKINSYEKMLQIILYFFKKISVDEKEKDSLNEEKFDISKLQLKLIELENILVFHNKLIDKFHLTNEKNNDILLQSENINNYLNEKIIEVKNENKVLK